MNIFFGVPAVFRFEWKRSLTIARITWWVVLTLFPPALFGLIRLLIGPPPADNNVVIPIFVYVLSPCVVCMMGVFLWATPAITSELEGRSWVYLAVRPYGAVSVLLGKYLAAVSWALPAGLISSLLSLLILMPDRLFHLIGVEWRLVFLSCMAYAAVFLLIGVLLPKRTMAFGVLYALVFEIFFANLPAVVNSLTIQFRLRCLFVRWMDEWDVSTAGRSPVFRSYFEDDSSWYHFGVLLASTVSMLIVAILVLRFREFTTSSETEV